jgi:hypothetical protein
VLALLRGNGKSPAECAATCARIALRARELQRLAVLSLLQGNGNSRPNYARAKRGLRFEDPATI